MGGALADADQLQRRGQGLRRRGPRGGAARQGRRQMAQPHRPHLAARHAQRHRPGRHAAACCAPRIIGAALLLWWQGAAEAGDIAFVLTTFFVLQGYLRDVGMHIRNLQRSVNDMEELVDAARPAARHRGPAGRHADRHRRGRHRLRPRRPSTTAATPRRSTATSRSPSRPGEKVGLVGHSGSGKTTFVKLIQRLYDVTGGRILIDGQDIATGAAGLAAPADRHRAAGADPVPPLAGREHRLCPARRHPGRDRSHAAKLANAHDFIERLPKGYETLVGERGVKLSGGERQRVAIARAFLADAPILILDEATSSLDCEIGGADPGGDGAADGGPHHHRHRPPAVDGAGARPAAGVRRGQDRRGRHATSTLVSAEGGIYRRLFERQALELTKGLAAAE